MSQTSPSATRPGPVELAVLAHPLVTIVRFGAKLAMFALVAPAQVGHAALAGVLVFGAGHLAIVGLDEAAIAARRLGAGLWAHLSRRHRRAELACALLVALLGGGLAAFGVRPELAGLLLALAPMVVLANLSVLPTALLVRRRAYAEVLRVDLGGVLAMALCGIVAAALGAGAWSFVVAWYANAAVATLLARRAVRGRLPAPDEAEDDPRRTARTGMDLLGATALGYGTDRGDALAVGAWLSPAVMGLYEVASQIPQALVQYARSLAERLLLPTMSAGRRGEALAGTSVATLRITVCTILPAFVVAALCAPAFIRLVFDERWTGAAFPMAVLCLAAGARSVQVVALTALKAGGRSRAAVRLVAGELVLLVVTLAAGLPFGALGAAFAVLASRVAAAALALTAMARALPGPRPAPAGPRRAVVVLCAWSAVFVPGALLLSDALVATPGGQLAATVALAAVLWLAARWVIDRPQLRVEWDRLAARLHAAGRVGTTP